MKHNSMKLSSAFRVRARLCTNIGDVRHDLASLACLQQLSSGSTLRYLISGRGPEPVSTVLELTAQEITLSYAFDVPGERARNDSLLVLLAVLAYLGRHYSVEMASVYSYIIEALRGRGQLGLVRESKADQALSERVEALSMSNSAVSRALCMERERCCSLEEELEFYRSLSGRMIGRLREMLGGRFRSEGEAMLALGIEDGAVHRALLDRKEIR